MYVVKLNEKEMGTLLIVVKNDFDYAYNDGDNSDVLSMQEDIELLESISFAFNNEDAKMKLEMIISDYKRKLRSVQ